MDSGGTETAWNVEYGVAGFAMGTGTNVSVTNDSLYILGLSSATYYDYYVQADCGTDSSIWVGPFTFLTGCGVYTAPYTESFENGGAMPLCWGEYGSQVSDYGGNITGDNWNFTDYNAYAGYYMHIGGNYQDLTPFPNGYCAFVNGLESIGATSNSGPATLVSPLIDVSTLTTLVFHSY